MDSAGFLGGGYSATTIFSVIVAAIIGWKLAKSSKGKYVGPSSH